MMKLLLATDKGFPLNFLSDAEAEKRGLTVLAVSPEGSVERAACGSTRIIGLSGRRPDFGAIAGLIEQERPVACILPDDGLFSQLFGVAANSMSVPVMQLVNSAAQLRNLPYHDKPKPDLFLLTDLNLYPQALEDPRYGSTLLPLAAADGAGGVTFCDIVERWVTGNLDTVEPDLSIIVPAFRETANLAPLCSRLLQALHSAEFSWELVLVDDCSPDDTYRAALEQMRRSPRIRAFTKPTPRGMGNAIRHGLAMARASVLVVTMADGSDEVDRIPDLYDAVHRGGYSLAIGSRYRKAENYENIPWLYRFWSRGFRLCAYFLTGLRLSDYTNAFRAFDRKIFARNGLESGGFEISPEITFKAWLTTRRVTEVDVRHLKRSSGQSKFSFLKAGPGYLKILIKAVVARLTRKWFILDW